MGAHLIDGKFQSNKYPTCPAGKIPLSTKDPMAQDLLWIYAQRRRSVDAELSDDLETALIIDGFKPEPKLNGYSISDGIAEFTLINPKSSGPEPYVPSKAIVAVQYGIPFILYRHGNDLQYWIECVGEKHAAKEIAENEKDGIYYWNGKIESHTDYWGEHDAWLETKELRLISKEEWQTFIDDELPWDWEKIHKHDAWLKNEI